MRIRQIKPSWWLDKELRRRLSAEAREFYIGLWMVADDAGWIEWDIERIAAELYPYDQVARREKAVRNYAGALERLDADQPHLVIHECGHAQVPKMPGHQRNTGRLATTVSDRHKRVCSHMRPHATTSGPVIGRVGKEERNGSGSGTVDAREAQSDYAAEVVARLARRYPVKSP